MKKLIIKIIILCLVLASFIACVIMPQYENGYLAAFKDKYSLLHSPSEGARIILLGDSNVAFGIDSELLEEAFEMEVINMGMHGGLGQAFCMDIAKSGIKEGDIVIILPSYFGYEVDGVDGTLAWMMLENDIVLWKEVNPRDYKNLIWGFPSYLKRALTGWINNLELSTGFYVRNAFNSYGDIETTGNENIMEYGHVPNDYNTSVNIELINYFNEYNAFVESQGAEMLLACAPLIDSPERPTDGSYEECFMKVKESINFNYISNWENYIYPMEYFYDTNAHLNDFGREKRTQQLIEDIELWMVNKGV